MIAKISEVGSKTHHDGTSSENYPLKEKHDDEGLPLQSPVKLHAANKSLTYLHYLRVLLQSKMIKLYESTSLMTFQSHVM